VTDPPAAGARRGADAIFVAVTRSSVERLDRHGLEFVDSAATAWQSSVFFRNATTGVEFREEDRAVFVVRIGALRGGRMPAIPSPLEVGSVFAGYDLGDLIDVRAPDRVIAQPPLAAEASQWAANLGAWADASVATLQDTAADVLDGDFRVFSQLDDRIRARHAARLPEASDAAGSS
jgi:hypothetical protein